MSHTYNKGLSAIVVLGVMAVVLIAGVWLWKGQYAVPKASDIGKEMGDGAMMDDDHAMMEHGIYKDVFSTYTPTVLASELAKPQKTVLFFYASWCPFCKAADKEFRARPEDIPEGVVVLKINYDGKNGEADLKRKYGVTYQHTFVQLDSEGNAIATWVSGDTKALVMNIK